LSTKDESTAAMPWIEIMWEEEMAEIVEIGIVGMVDLLRNNLLPSAWEGAAVEDAAGTSTNRRG